MLLDMYWKIINDYPDGMEPFTKLSLWEAKHVFDSTLDEEVKYFIITVDFQEFWQHVKKDIQSSTSGIHFRHYKADSYDKLLLNMETTVKLNLAART